VNGEQPAARRSRVGLYAATAGCASMANICENLRHLRFEKHLSVSQ
jgi:hypothetical protein